MAKQTIDKLKSWFKTALKPTQQQFWDWMDSYWHKDEKIAIDNVDGLTDIVNNTASATVLNTVSASLNLHLNDKQNPHSVTKEQLGLSLVNNTSDIDKPVSNAAQNALNNKLSQGGDAFAANMELGTADANDVVVKTNNVECARFSAAGDVSLNKLLKAGMSYGYANGVFSVEDWGTYKTRMYLRPAGNSAGWNSLWWSYLENNGGNFGLYAGHFQTLNVGFSDYPLPAMKMNSGSPHTIVFEANLTNNRFKGTGNRALYADPQGNLLAGSNDPNQELGSVDDSGGILTSAQLNTAFPNTQTGQRAYGTDHLYIKKPSGTWAAIQLLNI